MQGGPGNHSSHLPIPVVMSSGEVEYIAAVTDSMRESHLHMLTYDLRYLGTSEYANTSKYNKIIIPNGVVPSILSQIIINIVDTCY